MKRIPLFGCIAFGWLALFSSCEKEQNSPGKTKVITLPAGGEAVVEANNAFAFTFLHALLQSDAADNNKLISPLSLSLALSMVYNGADGATKDSIAHTLQVSGIDINNLNEVCQSLITQLPAEDSRVEFSIANSIWYNQNNYQPLPPFTATLQSYYSAAAQPADFTVPATVNTINKWVSDQTHSKIKEILESVSPGDLMYLINAIYFKGTWQTKFLSSATHNQMFYTPGGAKSLPFMTVDMMTNFYKDSLFTLAELPYGNGDSYSMYIALPTGTQTSANTFAASFTDAMLTTAINHMDSSEMEISIPKWEYAYNIGDMRPVLSALGMGNAFTEEADFSKMYNSSEVKPYITKAVHKTYIKVDEEGTEAAAATGVGIGTTATNLRYFIADHPFLYAIAEKQTGTILFTGIINSPVTE